MTPVRTATCRCGQLTLTCRGEPVRISVCHCYDCQKRSGSAFAVQARFECDAVTIAGERRAWRSTADSGGVTVAQFCPVCGFTLWYQCQDDTDVMAIAVGAFADATFPGPGYSGYEARKHAWVTITGDDVEHFD